MSLRELPQVISSIEKQIAKMTSPIDALVSFIELGGLRTALMEIGDVHYQAARRCLENVALANNPREQILLTVGHLQAAQSAFQEVQKGTFTRMFRGADYLNSCILDMITACILFACYLYLGEKRLAQDSIYYIYRQHRRLLFWLKLIRSDQIGKIPASEYLFSQTRLISLYVLPSQTIKIFTNNQPYDTRDFLKSYLPHAKRIADAL